MVQRRVSSRGGIMVATQKIQVGLVHAGKIVTGIAEDHSFRIQLGDETVRMVPRTTTSEIHRYKANATDKRSSASSTRKDGDCHGRSEATRGGRGRTD